MDPLVRTSGPFARTLPVPTRREDVVEERFGHSIADPYRWLEDGQSEEVRRWTDEQNALTRRVLDRVPGRDQLHARLHELLSIGSIGTPVSRKLAAGHSRYFYTRRDGRQNQHVLYARDGVAGKDEPLVDPNALSSEGTTALDWWFPSEDGRHVAYGLSENGDEQSTLYVRDVERKIDLPDRIDRTRYASIAWLPDGKGFYYTRYPAKGSVAQGEEGYHRLLYLHRLGDDPDRDAYVFGKGRAMTDSPSVDLSPDGRWLLVSVSEGWAKTELYLKDLHAKKGADFQLLTGGKEAVFEATAQNDALYVRTNDGASRYRLFSVDPLHPARTRWTEVLPEHATDVLDGAALVGNDLIATYLVDASSRLRLFSRTGEPKGEVSLPTLGSTSGAEGRWDGDEAFYDFSSYAVAPTIYRLDLHTGQPEKWEAVEAPIDPAAFEVERIAAESKDGTRIPAFLVHRKGLQKSGKTPTVLTGYGGFNINIVPTFSRSSYALLERGGILAVANLRGGGEFGEAWHRGGMLEHKQNVF
ncbi:MAG TPA: prolyl oligopeptidase family serine peptidase, partial [Polyangiaceae bacterium]